MGVTGGGATTSAAVQGRLMGGQQPVSGSTVQLYAATNSSYGGASTALLSAAVISDANGGFSISNLYTCPTATTQVYIVAKGGNPGLTSGTNNTALGLMAALGDCGNLTTSTNIIINEVTTVSAAWALAPFMTAYDHVGSSAGNATGLRNAFGMAGNIASTARGASPGDAPAGATIPAAEVNTLANILASCVNTQGPGVGTPCTTLFTQATPPAGTAPTNTIDAALDIALNPANNAGGIFALAPALGPFQPTLSTPPNDWTVAVNFSIGNRSTNGFAFDATGNLWVVSPDALYELSPQGAPLGSYAAMAGNGVAIDATGNIWVTSGSSLLKMPSTLGAPATYAAANGGGSPNNGLAIDGVGNAWYTCDSCSAVYKVNAAGTYVGAYAETGVVHASNVSVDGSENIWLGNYDSGANVNELLSGGSTPTQRPCGACGNAGFVANDGSGNAWIVGYDLTRLTPGGTFTNYESPTGGLFNPSAVALDGSGNAWVANTVGLNAPSAGSLSEFTNAGAAVSPAFGYVSDTLASPTSIAVDGSGNVWLRNTGNATVTAFVGAGVPVVTPLALGVKNNKLGSKP